MFQKNNVKIVNNSWGLTYYPLAGKMIDYTTNSTSFADKYKDFSSDVQNVLKIANDDIGLKATMDLAKAGVLQVYSSGNEGQRSPNLNSVMPSYDEDLRGWINVGAIDTDYFTKKNGAFEVKNNHAITKGSNNEVYIRNAFTSYSNSFRGAQAFSILAPGYEIISANAYYNTGKTPYSKYAQCTSQDGDELSALSGTSQAAPFVAGAAALVLEKYPFANGRLLADIILSTANSNINAIPEIMIKQSPNKWKSEQDNWVEKYYYDIIYTKDTEAASKSKDEIKNDLINKLNVDSALADEIVSHLMHDSAVYMSKEELIGQGILDVDKALGGLGKLDANRMSDKDVKASSFGDKKEQAIYTIDTGSDKDASYTFSNDISQKTWVDEWHNPDAENAPKKLRDITKIGLEKTGDGMLTLSGKNTYEGDTIVSQGSLRLTGSITSDTEVKDGANFILGNSAKSSSTAKITGNVLNSGTFAGIGLIDGDFENEGVLKAGFYNETTDLIMNLGTLSVSGKYTQVGDNSKLQLAFGKNDAKELKK